MSTACARVYNLPGPRGPAGSNGTDGVDGINAFTELTAEFVMPAVGGTVAITVEDTSWMVESTNVGGPGEIDGQVVAVQFGGSFLITAIADGTHATLYNLGYPGNASPGAAIPAGARVSPAGQRGESGSVAAGSLQAANNLSDLTNIATALNNLGLGALAVLDVITPTEFSGVLPISKGGTGGANQAAARTALGLGDMAVQNANAVAIIGGTIVVASVTATTLNGTTANLGTVIASTLARIAGTLFTPPSAIQSLLAATAVAPNAATIRVVGNGGAVTLVATPTISTPAADGQRLRIRGTDNTNTVAFQDEGSLAGSKLQLGAASRTLGLGDTLELEYDSTTGFWYEILFIDLP